MAGKRPEIDSQSSATAQHSTIGGIVCCTSVYWLYGSNNTGTITATTAFTQSELLCALWAESTNSRESAPLGAHGTELTDLRQIAFIGDAISMLRPSKINRRLPAGHL